MKRLRIFWQLFPLYALVMIALLVVVVFFGEEALRTSHLEQTAASLEAIARGFAQSAQDLLARRDATALDELAKRVGAETKTRITVVWPSGVVAADSDEDPRPMKSHLGRPEIAAALDTQQVGQKIRFSDTLQQDLLYVAVPVPRDGPTQAVVRASMPLTAVEGTLRSFERRVFAVALVAAACIVAASWLIARRISRPLETITAGAQRFGRGELDYRLSVGGSQETAALADALNAMAAQLGEQIQTIVCQRNTQDAVLSSMVEGVLTLDEQGRVLDFNRAATEMFQLDPAAAQGRPIQEVVRKAPLLEFIDKTLSSSLPLHEDLVLHHPQQPRYFTAYGVVLRDAQDQRIGVLIVLRDITRLRQLENVRRDFVANASHELRTPITSIKGFVETLLEGALDDKPNATRFLEIIHKQVNRLDAIITDILSLAQIEQQSEEPGVATQRGPIRPVLEAAAQMCREKAQKKQISLAVEAAPDLTARINPGLLEQAMVNLLDNAIKYSPAGSPVRIEAAREADAVVIRVIDRGCGIEARHLPRLFERFYTVSKAQSRELGGTGLGLAIVKHIALAHGGTVAVQSKVGAGSTFSLALPAG